MKNRFAIIEIGSNNTKTHVYEDEKVIYENNSTIEFKVNYKKNHQILSSDLEELYKVIDTVKKFTSNIYIYGCSIFRSITKEELEEINHEIYDKYHLKIKVVSQEEEAYYTASGCYSDIEYDGTLCIFIGGGGSIELIFVKNKEIIDKKYYQFGVIDVTNKFESLKDDIPNVTFDEVYHYIEDLMGEMNRNADVLVLAGGDHLYWYDHAGYELMKNELYTSEKQKYMITREMSDQYDQNALVVSLDYIRQKSDNPKWFDGARAMKMITNLVSHKIHAKYIVPTKINMEDGLRNQIKNDSLGKN